MRHDPLCGNRSGAASTPVHGAGDVARYGVAVVGERGWCGRRASGLEGGRFEPVQISEEGRALLASKLTQLTGRQIRDLFEGAHFPPAGREKKGDVTSWVTTFQEKVRQIADRSCPS